MESYTAVSAYAEIGNGNRVNLYEGFGISNDSLFNSLVRRDGEEVYTIARTSLHFC
jgi:hypothetical protein